MKLPEKRINWGFILAVLLIIPFASLLPLSYCWGYSDDDCMDCHAVTSDESMKKINVEGFLSSVHGGETGCSECHRGVRDEGHMEVEDSGAVDCGSCHPEMGVHGNDASIACYTCHSRHDMYDASDTRSTLHWQNLEQTCGGCHPQQVERPKGIDLWSVFQISSHLKQDISGSFSVNMCIGCHQGAAAHGENDPINDQNCYKCHMVTSNHADVLGYVHASSSRNLLNRSTTRTIHVAAISATVIFLILKMLNIVPSRGNKKNKRPDI